MIKRSIIATLIFGIASFAGLSIGIGSPFAADNAVIDENDRVVLHRNVHPKARPEFDAGPTDPSLPMDRIILLLKLTPEKQALLNRLVAEQQDPSSPNFHRWLTPEEFGGRFGRSPQEIATVSGWLVSHGFTIEETAKGGTWINFSGTAADVERAFHANMHDYRVHGYLRHANSTDPSIPRGLAGLVAGPVSLNNFPHKAMHTKPRPMPEAKLQPGYTESDGSHDLAPGDFAAIYDVNNVYNLGYDGAGVTIAIVGRTNPDPGKWDTFRSTFGLPNNPPHVILNGLDPGDLGGNEDTEADLDVEWSGAVAKGATIDFVTSKTTNSADGVDLSAQYIVDHNLAPIMNDSFGDCESDLGSTWRSFYFNLWEQAASQGITVFVVSGDSGAYDCTDNNGNPLTPMAVNGLASTPYNIAVGGTSLSNASEYWNPVNGADGVSALGYIPEVAWNNLNQGYYWASGGGASDFYSKPAWQVSPGVPNDGRRDMPDVSLNADPFVGYRVFTCTNQSGVCTSNSWQSIGGTSAASPSFAGIMALIVQSTGGQRQGNANSVMYQLGNAQYGGASGANAVFHDITSGNNGFGANLSGYSCTVGYDLVTGLGSVDATNLLLAFQEIGVLAVKTFKIVGTGSAGSTSSRTVTLYNTTTGGIPTYYMASESSTFSGATWKTYSTAPSFTLSDGNGTKTVYFKVENAKSVSAKVSSTIQLAQLPTVTSFKINGGAATTISPTVTLNNTATISPTQFTASESPDFTGAVWQAYATAPSFTLSPGSGTKTVYFKVRNSAGESTIANDTIQLIVRPTVTSLQINNGAAVTPSRTVTLNNTAANSPTYYMASQSPNFPGAVWKTYSPDPLFTLSAGTGLKTVYFKVKNAAGASTVASADITLD
ncbi:MAG: S53 family peptidase [Syntrophobacteraceae bacterium]